MSLDAVSRSIFITNTFAKAHPEEHIKLWEQFEKEVPFNKRSGAYGADNLAYIKWIRTQDNPVVKQFLSNDIVYKTL